MSAAGRTPTPAAHVPGPARSVPGPASVVRAAGAVLWRPGHDGSAGAAAPEIAVVHRPHHGDWSLPKGKVDPGESLPVTAVREIAEETGFAAVLGRHLRTVHYPVGADRKVVDYWAARAGAGGFVPGGETDALCWLDPAAAAAQLSYDSDRDVLDTFRRGRAATTTAVLVRHAKAGKRAQWDGPDAERPLSTRGRAQAERLAGTLAAFGVEALVSVDKTRCEQTLAPAAARLGLGVATEPAFADEAVGADPGRATTLLRSLLASGPVPAVCAQGDGIPLLVRGLAADSSRPAASNRRLDDPPCRKGSVWVLSFAPVPGGAGDASDGAGELVAADYYRDP